MMSHIVQKSQAVRRMLQITILSVCAVVLTGCLTVNDFGGAWQQTQLAPELAGRWQKQVTRKTDKTVEQILFTAKGDGYDVEAYKDGELVDDFASVYPAKSLSLGNYRFLLSRTRGVGGEMIRYAVQDKQLTFYKLQPSALQSIQVKEKKVVITPDAVSDSADIMRLDAATLRKLSALPDDKATWYTTVVYKKVP